CERRRSWSLLHTNPSNMNLASWLDRAARADPGRAAIFHGARRWATYGELAARVARLARGLREHARLGAGDRVAIFMKNRPEYLEALYAAWWAGLVAVPVNAKLHRKELAFIVEDSGAKLVIEEPAQLDELRSAEAAPLARAHATDLAWLSYTSGTTGR